MTGKATECDVRLSGDALVALLDCWVPDDNVEQLVEQIGERLAGLGIDPSFEPPDRSELARIVRAAGAEQGPDLKDVVLMEGVPAGESQDGSVAWTRDFFTQSFSLNETTGQVDFREQTADPSIEEDQLVATVMPPVLGTPGRSLRGVAVAARPPASFDLAAGAGIRQEEGTGRFYAEITGRLRRNGRDLAVDRVHSVSGNVNMETGNVHHPDAVVISGDVEPGARVEAGGSLEIKGLLDGGAVQTGGDLLVRCTLIGRHGARVQAEGGVSAQAVRSADIEAGGDVVVLREVITSTVRTQGSLSVHRGRIAGGRACAVGGIVVAQAGSPAEVATSLELLPGTDGSTDAAASDRRAVIVVLDRAFPGTRFVVGDHHLDLNEEVRGPVQTAIVEGKLVLQACPSRTPHRR